MPTQAYGSPARGDLAPCPRPAAPEPTPEPTPGAQPGAPGARRALAAPRAWGRAAVAPPGGRPEGGPPWWAGAREAPLPWAARATVRRQRLGTFRLPAPDDPPPAAAAMLGVCAWAALLAVLGLAVAGRAVVAMLAANAPGWYEPTVLTCGVVGIGLTAAAFLAVHQPRLPWGLLTGASVPLAVNLISTAAAF